MSSALATRDRSIGFAVAMLALVVTSVRLSAQTQSPPASPLRFDAASIKLSSDQRHFSRVFDRLGEHVIWTTDLRSLIEYAYRVQIWQVSGSLPASIYEINAVADPATTDDQLRLMFQSLLADRLDIALHRAEKNMPGMALTVAKGGPKMQEAKEGTIPPFPKEAPDSTKTKDLAAIEHGVSATLPRRNVVLVIGRRVTMQQLSDRLSTNLQSPVFNFTDLPGEYYFAFEYAEGDDPDSDAPPLAVALRGLGLQIDRHVGTVETLVVDHIETNPTPN